jgi:tetratricopeptide (TPR) repeat protein
LEALSTSDAIAQALRHHAAGELRAAEALYHEILRREPDHAEALYLLGVIAYQEKRHALAVELLRRAIGLDSGQSRYHNALGAALMGLGRRAEAIASYRQALALQPDLGEAHNNLGNALREEGRLSEAMECYRRALALNPSIVEAHNNLGNLLKLKGELQAAVTCFQRALALKPSYAGTYSNLGDALEAMGRLEEAVESCRRALSLDPDFAEAYSNLGNALNKLGRVDEAIAAHDRAIVLQPGNAQARCNKGVVLYGSGRADDAIAAYGRALELNPDLAAAHWGRSIARLMKGEYPQGWKEYEYRWDGCPWLKGGRPVLALPQWRGEGLVGRRILIHAEQGLGDEIMFSSIIPEIAREASGCLIECSPKLEQLFRRSFPNAEVLANDRSVAGWQSRIGKWLEGLPPVQVQSPIGSLPLYRRKSLAEFPKHRGYLKANARRVRYWKDCLAKLGGRMKIGISWRGGRPETGMARRSMDLEQLLPVLRLPGAQFVNLQYTDCSDEIERLASENGIEIANWLDALDEFDETAALVKALDLVLSVCTSVIHLGGALGQKTWVMAPHAPEWRYGLSGETMPWYPSVRIFRQSSPGNWDAVVAAVLERLQG